MSSIRIDIEHSFGPLKSRWQSLKEMRLRIFDDPSYEFVVKWITACIVLHNFLLSLDDPEWEDETGEYEGDGENEDGEGADCDTDGRQRRKEIRDMVLYNMTNE